MGITRGSIHSIICGRFVRVGSAALNGCDTLAFVRTEPPSMREYAAICCALGVARGMLYSIQFAQYDPEEVERILRGTSSANIAAAIGEHENDLAINWDDYLTSSEKLKIQGRKSGVFGQRDETI